MAARDEQVHGGSRANGATWFLVVLLGLCVEFWIAVATVVAESV